MGLNIGLVVSTVFSVWSSQSVPGILAVSCGAVGGVTLFARVKAWRTGKTRLLYDLVRDDEEATKKMRIFDVHVLGHRGVQSGRLSLVCVQSVFE